MPEDFRICYLPIIVNDNVIGIMSVWGPDLQEEDIPGLMVFSNQVSTSINNAKLYDQAQKEIITRTEAEKRSRKHLLKRKSCLRKCIIG